MLVMPYNLSSSRLSSCLNHFTLKRVNSNRQVMDTIAMLLNRTLRKPIPIILVLASTVPNATNARSAETQTIVSGNTAFAIDLMPG